MNDYHLSLLNQGYSLIIWNNKTDSVLHKVGDIIDYANIKIEVLDASKILEFSSGFQQRVLVIKP